MTDRFSQRDRETQRDPEYRIANSVESALIDLGDVLKKLPASTRLRRLQSAIAELQEAEPWLLMLRDQVSCGPGTEPAQKQRDEQIKSFAYGNAHLSNPAVTREIISEEADKLTQAAVGDLNRLGAIPRTSKHTCYANAEVGKAQEGPCEECTRAATSWWEFCVCGAEIPYNAYACVSCAQKKVAGAIQKPEPVTRRSVALTAPEMAVQQHKCAECGVEADWLYDSGSGQLLQAFHAGVLCDDCAERKANDKEGM